MNFPAKLTVLSFTFASSLSADHGVPPDAISFHAGSGGSWSADWSGIHGRSYFFQWSTDLESWAYAPFVDFSDGIHSRGCLSSTSRFFIRHSHTDLPTTDPELEDFAEDGVGSLIKLLMGLDPFAPLAWVDADNDGIHDAIEEHWFGNLTSTDGSGSNTDNGIRDVFAIQAGQDPTTDLTVDSSKRSNFSYDSMGRLTEADDVIFVFDIEGNLESSH